MMRVWVEWGGSDLVGALKPLGALLNQLILDHVRDRLLRERILGIGGFVGPNETGQDVVARCRCRVARLDFWQERPLLFELAFDTVPHQLRLMRQPFSLMVMDVDDAI